MFECEKDQEGGYEPNMMRIRKDVSVCAAVRSGGTGLGRGTRNVFPCRSYCVCCRCCEETIT